MVVKKFMILFTFLMLFMVSCSYSKTGQRQVSSAAAEQAAESLDQGKAGDDLIDAITNNDLDKLLEQFEFPAQSYERVDQQGDTKGFPDDLVDRIKKAVYFSEAEALIDELNDESLMVTTDDFLFEPDFSDPEDWDKMRVSQAIQNKGVDCYFYQLDLDGDNIDEIIMIDDEKYDYSYSNKAYLLKKSGDHYVYINSNYVHYYRCLAIFQYDGRFYLAANFDEYETKTSKAVGLFTLDEDFFQLFGSESPYIYIRKTNDGYQYHSLYKNESFPDIDLVEDYVEEIQTDLMYTNRINQTFYGDEEDQWELLAKARELNSEINLWRLFSADADNDGQDEYFDRGSTKMNWYASDTLVESPCPFTPWVPEQYLLTQRWFKDIGQKTVVCSLYQKNSEDIYLLDVRLQVDDQTVILLDYMIDLCQDVQLSDYWDYDDSNWVEITYSNPDYKKAFPDNLSETIDQLSIDMRGDFKGVTHEDQAIPGGLIMLLEKALYDGVPHSPELESPSFEIDKEVFFQKFYSDIDPDGNEVSETHVCHVYQYSLDNQNYYLTVTDSGGSARLVAITIDKETENGLEAVDYLISLDFDAKVIEYEQELYLIDVSYNYYSKYTDAVFVYKLVPGKLQNYVVIRLEPDTFHWERIYSMKSPYEKAVSEYIDGLKEDLMEKSIIDDNLGGYVGDETDQIDKDKFLRLKSVGGERNYYMIDFNNDGQEEYFSRHFWYPSNYTMLYLISNFYRFTDERIVETSFAFYEGDGWPLQLWFKEIDGKIFTFRLDYLGNDYLLNVSLIEGTDIQQVRTDIIVPKEEVFRVFSEEIVSE